RAESLSERRRQLYQILSEELLLPFLMDHFSRVPIGKASRTELLVVLNRLEQRLQAQVSEGIGTDELPNILHRFGRGDELPLCGGVDTVVAGTDNRRRRNSHVNLLSPHGANNVDDLPAGSAAHNRIVDQNDALVSQDFSHRVEFDLDPEVTDRLFGLDEGSTH